jgi:hypothetical protein
VAKLEARLLATAAFWARIQTSLKNTKWGHKQKEWLTHKGPPKKIYTKTVAKEQQILRLHFTKHFQQGSLNTHFH